MIVRSVAAEWSVILEGPWSSRVSISPASPASTQHRRTPEIVATFHPVAAAIAGRDHPCADSTTIR